MWTREYRSISFGSAPWWWHTIKTRQQLMKCVLWICDVCIIWAIYTVEKVYQVHTRGTLVDHIARPLKRFTKLFVTCIPSHQSPTIRHAWFSATFFVFCFSVPRKMVKPKRCLFWKSWILLYPCVLLSKLTFCLLYPGELLTIITIWYREIRQVGGPSPGFANTNLTTVSD